MGRQRRNYRTGCSPWVGALLCGHGSETAINSADQDRQHGHSPR